MNQQELCINLIQWYNLQGGGNRCSCPHFPLPPPMFTLCPLTKASSPVMLICNLPENTWVGSTPSRQGTA